LNPFLLDTASLSESFFRLEGADLQETTDLYLTPLFFKFAGARLLSAAEEAGIPEFAPAPAPASSPAPTPTPTPSPTPTPTESLDPSSREPRWLLWRAQDLDAVDDRSGPMAGAIDGRPRVLASFQDGHPALVERSLGRGRVLFFASGLQSSWCTIARTHAVILFDRIARDAVERTLPRRVFGTTEQVSFRIDPSQRRARFALERPGGAKEILVAEALGPDTFGLPLRGATRRGIYRIDASREESQGAGGKLFELECAVNGPERESSLLRIAETALRERLGSLPFRWVGPGEPISIDAAQVGVSSLWKWILVAVLALLALEMGILAWPALRGSRAAPAGESVRSAVGGSLGS
jgi:hypothetical protein